MEFNAVSAPTVMVEPVEVKLIFLLVEVIAPTVRAPIEFNNTSFNIVWAPPILIVPETWAVVFMVLANTCPLIVNWEEDKSISTSPNGFKVFPNPKTPVKLIAPVVDNLKLFVAPVIFPVTLIAPLPPRS